MTEIARLGQDRPQPRLRPARLDRQPDPAGQPGEEAGRAGARVEVERDVILPICQYYAYVEVGMDDEDDQQGSESSTNLWRAYRRISDDAPFAMRKVRHRRDIYPVFRELFARRPEGVAAEGG